MTDTPPSSALERLRQWETAGGGWHVVRLGDQGATVELERCDLGEAVDRITSADPDFLTHLRREPRGRSHPRTASHDGAVAHVGVFRHRLLPATACGRARPIDPTGDPMAQDDTAALAEALSADGDMDVTVDGDDLLVRGRRFARTTERGLVVHLPPARTADLVARGIVEAEAESEDGRGEWVLAADRENWHELASEARDFIGEPAVGRDS